MSGEPSTLLLEHHLKVEFPRFRGQAGRSHHRKDCTHAKNPPSL